MCLDERGVVLCFYTMQLGVGGSVCGRANIPKDIEDHRRTNETDGNWYSSRFTLHYAVDLED
jgi:hypothetical protein